MTPADLTAARERLGLTAAALGRALELEGRDPGRYVRAWETGAHPIPGPVRVALRLMLAGLSGRPPAVKRGRVAHDSGLTLYVPLAPRQPPPMDRVETRPAPPASTYRRRHSAKP